MSQKTAIITGASRGIGRATAWQLARDGYFVVPVARNKEEIKELEYELDSAGFKSLGMICDVTDADQTEVLVARVMRDFGRLDVLVNNAGIGVFKAAETIELTEWEQVMDVNVKGSFLLSKMALPHMIKAGSGHIIAVASDVSKRTFANGSLYCASKYAQDAFFSALRREVRAKGIKVSVIYPGLVDTYFHGGSPGEPNRAQYLRSEDIAAAVSYVVNAPAHVIVDELMLHPMVQEW